MNPPAAIDAVSNRIARREALAAVPDFGFDTALPPLRFQVEPTFLRNAGIRFLASTASSNVPAWGRLETNRIYDARNQERWKLRACNRCATWRICMSALGWITGGRAPAGLSKIFYFRCKSPARAGEDVHQALCAVRVRFQRLTGGSKGTPPAVDTFAERSQAGEDGLGGIAVLLEIGAAVIGDCVKPWRLGSRGRIARFRKTGQRRIDDARSRRVPIRRLLLDQLDDLVAATGRLGDERECDQT